MLEDRGANGAQGRFHLWLEWFPVPDKEEPPILDETLQIGVRRMEADGLIDFVWGMAEPARWPTV